TRGSSCSITEAVRRRRDQPRNTRKTRKEDKDRMRRRSLLLLLCLLFVSFVSFVVDPLLPWSVMRGLFITGTDTGVAKPEVTAARAGLGRRRGRSSRAPKPVAPGGLADANGPALAAGDSPQHVPPLLFPEPAAPPVAARLAGRELSLPMIVEALGPLDGTLL